MTHLQKARMLSTLKWVSSNSVDSCKIQPFPAGSIFYNANSPRFYRRKKVVDYDNVDENSMAGGQFSSQFSNVVRKKAQTALLEYLHSTRSLQVTDAEHMSKNSPDFLEKLLQKVDVKEDIAWSVARFLRYHPINEFEPFFESLGLSPRQYRPLLPRDLMFLSDDELLMENFHTLCNYGIPRKSIGRIYKDAGEVFRYDFGVLGRKLRAYEERGFDQSFIGKVVARTPHLLIGDLNLGFIKSMEILRKAGIEYCWIEEHLYLNCSYNWSQFHALLNLFRQIGYSQEQLRDIISQNPWILFEGSGDRTLSLIGFLVKFGFSVNHLCSMFVQFPRIPVGIYLSNMRQCFLFLTEIEMDVLEIGKIVRSHRHLLGSCTLKKTDSLLTILNTGKKRLCDIILQNPEEMRNWVMGSKVKAMLPSDEKQQSRILKIKFLLDLGFTDNSTEMEKALKVFRGKGAELEERLECIMQAGLDRKKVCEMVKQYPQILNQKKKVIKMKIDFLVNDAGYPISSLLSFPSFLCYTISTLRLRLAMYNWLKDQGKVDPLLSLSTIIAISDNVFVKRYVKLHPKGCEFWQELKKKESI